MSPSEVVTMLFTPRSTPRYPSVASTSPPEATELARLQREAPESGLGFWTEGTPLPPWVWRRREDNTGVGGFLSLALILSAGVAGGIVGGLSESLIWGTFAAAVAAISISLGYTLWLKEVSSGRRQKPPTIE